MDKVTQPLPIPNPDTEPFWQGCARGELLLQRCGSCRSFRHPPSPMCPSCLSLEFEWFPASGKGTVYSFVIVRESLRGWNFEVPYVVAIIELAEGPHMLSNVVAIDADRVHIGMPVGVSFERINEEITLPKFKSLED